MPNRPPKVAIDTFKPKLRAALTGKERKVARKQQFAAYQRKKKAMKSTQIMQAEHFDIAEVPRHTSTRWSRLNAKKDFREKIRREIEEG